MYCVNSYAEMRYNSGDDWRLEEQAAGRVQDKYGEALDTAQAYVELWNMLGGENNPLQDEVYWTMSESWEMYHHDAPFHWTRLDGTKASMDALVQDLIQREYERISRW